MKTTAILALSALLLSACQVEEFATDDTAELDGVWNGVLSDAKSHDPVRSHMLDGLMLSMELDTLTAHSAEVVLDNGEVAGIFARRSGVGERDTDYSVLGTAVPYERLEADLIGSEDDARLSLFYDRAESFEGASYRDAEGLYVYYGPDIEISMSIDSFGVVEAYDDAGCAYFGRLQVPDVTRNIYAVTLDVEGCAMDGDSGFGIGSIEFDGSGWDVLNLPIWFDREDRVEAWRLERV